MEHESLIDKIEAAKRNAAAEHTSRITTVPPELKTTSPDATNSETISYEMRKIGNTEQEFGVSDEDALSLGYDIRDHIAHWFMRATELKQASTYDKQQPTYRDDLAELESANRLVKRVIELRRRDLSL